MASTWIQSRHDIGITDVGTAGAGTDLIGMMLVQKNGVPQYQVFDDEYLASQFFTGVPGYGSLPPEKEIAMRQDDWRSGFGLEVYDADEPKRYHYSNNMDMRHRGMAICGPKATSVTMASGTDLSLLITNSGMENDSNWTGGAQSSTYKRTGTYSWKLGGAAATYAAYQDLAYVAGQAYTFTCYARSDTGGGAVCTIAIDDGVDETESSSTTTTSFVQISVTKTISASATRLRLILRAVISSDTYYGYFDDAAGTVTLTTFSGAIKAIKDFNDDLYFGVGCVLAKLNTTTGTSLTPLVHLSQNITALEAFTDDNLYIAIGASNDFWYMDNATPSVFTEVAGGKAYFFGTVHSATPTLWKALLPRSIYSATAPTTHVGWSGATTVDTSANNITQLLTFNNVLYVMKEDRPFYISSGPVVNTLTNITKPIATTNGGKNSIEWQGKIYMPWGNTILEYDDGTYTWRSPGEFGKSIADFAGDVQALAWDEQYLFAAVDNATKIEVMAGRLETISGTTSWVWHPISEITLDGAEMMFMHTVTISGVKKKRLWIASTLSTDALNYLSMPLAYGDVANDANRKFQTGGFFYTPWLHGNFRGDKKAWIKLTLDMGNAYDATLYFSVYYQIWGGTWVEIGNFTGTTAGRRQSRYIDVTNKPSSTMMRFRFQAVTTTDTTKTPILTSYEARAILYPTRRSIIACVVRCANEITCKNGQVDKAMYPKIKTTLDNTKNDDWPVAIRDIDGSTVYVKFLPLPGGMPRWTLVKDEKGRVQERHYNLLLQEVALS